MATTDPLLVTINEAATMLGVKRTTVYRLLDQNQVKGVKVRYARRITVASIHEYINQHLED